MTRNLTKIYFLLFFTVFIANAQDKIVALEFPGKNNFIDYSFTDTGSIFVVSGDAKKNEANLQRYDETVDQKFSKSFPTEYKGLGSFFGRGMNAAPVPYNMVATDDGAHLISIIDDRIFDAAGNSKKYDRYHEIAGFETAFKLLTNKYDLNFGSTKKDADGPSFYRTDLSDQSRKLIKLDFPGFESQISGDPTRVSASKSQIWEDAGFTEEQFYMVNKELNKERTENQYNIAGLDYDGAVVTKLSLVLKLKGKYFALSNSGFGGYQTVTYEGGGSSAMDENATGNVYFDKDFYYVYGLYTKDKGGDMNKIKYHGFYVYKFNKQGELLWSMEKAITGKGINSVQRPLAVEARFLKISGDRIGFRISNIMEKYAHFFIIDGADGKLAKEASPQYTIEGNRYVNYTGGTFATGFASKVFPKKHMDVNTLFATFLSPEVESFLKTASATDLNYNARISPNGVFLIEENFKAQGFRLLKFDWK